MDAGVGNDLVRTLAGLHFKAWFSGIWTSPEAKDFYDRLANEWRN